MLGGGCSSCRCSWVGMLGGGRRSSRVPCTFITGIRHFLQADYVGMGSSLCIGSTNDSVNEVQVLALYKTLKRQREIRIQLLMRIS